MSEKSTFQLRLFPPVIWRVLWGMLVLGIASCSTDNVKPNADNIDTAAQNRSQAPEVANTVTTQESSRYDSAVTPSGKLADLLRINCDNELFEENITISDSLQPKERIDLAKQAVCYGDERREQMAEAWGGETITVGYLFIGGSFAAQNVLANADKSVREQSLIVDVGQPGILMGSEDPGQPWELIFIGHEPPEGNPLKKIWSNPRDFKSPDNSQINASRKSLGYTLALNGAALGVPVIPCKAKVKHASEKGVEVECELVGAFVEENKRKVTIKVQHGVVITAGLGNPKGLDICRAPFQCQISEEDNRRLSKESETGLPFMFNEWQLFSQLRTGKDSVNFSGKKLIVMGSGAAAASAITDILNPKYLYIKNRPDKIFVLGTYDRLDDPGGFAPSVYTRARLASKCSVFNKTTSERKERCTSSDYTENEYSLDYFDLEFINTSARKAVVERVNKDSKVRVEVTPEALEAIEGDNLLVFTSNISTLKALFEESKIEFEPAKCWYSISANTEPCQLEDAKPHVLEKYKFDENGAPVALIGSGPIGRRFLVTGTSTINLEGTAFKQGSEKEWKKMLKVYQKMLEDDYAKLGQGGISNVNHGALLFQGWLTKEAGRQLTNWIIMDNKVPMIDMYDPDWVSSEE
ncbi:MAG: hypothetical protein L3J22_07010 [Xanthomonadales bacterium]|nr:hypothetical protein [Xanthomonadales bacterium]